MNSKFLTPCIAASLGTLAPKTFVAAQEAMIDEVLVTGSLIKRADIDGVGKISVLTADDSPASARLPSTTRILLTVRIRSIRTSIRSSTISSAEGSS